MTTHVDRDVQGICLEGGQTLERVGNSSCTSVQNDSCDVTVCDRIGCNLQYDVGQSLDAVAVSGEQLLNIPVASNHGTKPLAYAVADSGLAYPSSTGGTTTSIRGISTVDYLQRSRDRVPDRLAVGRPLSNDRGQETSPEEQVTQLQAAELVANQQFFGIGEDVSEALKTILNLGEAVNDDNSTTDDTSQRINAALAGYARENIDDDMTDHEQELMRSVQAVNDAVAAFHRAAAAANEPTTPTVPPIAQQLSAAERDELEQFRTLFGRLHLAPSSIYTSPGQQTDYTSVTAAPMSTVPRPQQLPEQLRAPTAFSNLQYGAHDVSLLNEQLPAAPVYQPTIAPTPQLSGATLVPPMYPQVTARPRAVGEAGDLRTPSLVPKEVKIDKPLTFNGDKKKLQNFLFVMRQYVDTVGLGDGPTACRFVVSYLRDDALTWWRSYSQDSLSVFDNISLDELLTALEEHFSDIDREMKLRAKLFNMRQTGSVAQFTTAFQQVQLELGTARVSDDVAMHLYVHALKPMTQQWVMMQRPETFQDCCLLAERADATLMWQRRGSQSATTSHQRPSHQRTSFNYRGVSQYGNSKYKGPAPMVLGNVTQQQKVVCHHCGRPGHMKKDCWQLHGKPAHAQKSRGGDKRVPPPPPKN